MADAASIPAEHARHDRLLIAMQADRAADRERGPSALGRALLAACTDCAVLSADLAALVRALPSAATPRRTRDFTLTAADAERLRPRGLRAWLARIGSPRDTFSKPLAIGFTTLGLAGLLVATAPTVLPLAGGAATIQAGPSAAAPSLEAMRGDDPAAPSDVGGLQQHDGGSGVTNEAPAPGSPMPATDGPSTDPVRAPVIALSASFLAVGGTLFVLRRRAGMR